MSIENPSPGPKGGAESPIIRIGEDRDRLRMKLEEYKKRLKASPYTAIEALDFDTIYKIAVAEKLVETGEVNTHALASELEEKYGVFNSDTFNNACGVIEDYIFTGGKNLHGGTGLPKRTEGEG